MFQVPFVLAMVACLGYALWVAYATDIRLLRMLALVCAFGTFCVAGTLGRAAWQAYRLRQPALAIDVEGITDLRADDPQALPWTAMERVHLDNYENRILVRLRPGQTANAWRVAAQALKRWQQRGDVVFDLRGLGYDTQQIQRALKAFHTASRRPPAAPDRAADTH